MSRYNNNSNLSSGTSSSSSSALSNGTQISTQSQSSQPQQSSDNKKSPNNHNQFDIVLPLGDGMPGVRTTYFTPTSIHIHAGDTVRWINKDTVTHTVTAMAFDSGWIWPSGSAEGPSTYSHTFNTPGIYVYFCEIHPYIGGIIYVDTEETQREITSTRPRGDNIMDTKVEIPQNAAYDVNYGPMFIPSGAHIPFGSKITFTNKDYVSHTATATDGTFDTGILQPGQSKSFILNDRQGTITYFCRVHPWMQAIITVDPPSPTFIQKTSQ